MQISISRILFLFILITCVSTDPIDRAARSGAVLKMLREMVNQTKADTLNLPANATSIRENISDTFSCENRTYGYYADVDNDCQIFHVCLTSQGPTGRNTTYRWSFICPQETVFNQEVLVCTRSRESIPCEDSPSYYDLNMEIGKVATDSETEKVTNQPNRNVERIKNQRRPVKKQNIIVEELMKEAMEEMETINEDIVESQDSEEVSDEEDSDVGVVSLDKINIDNFEGTIPQENQIPVLVEREPIDGLGDGEASSRLTQSFRTGRRYRGSIKFRNQ